MIHTKRGRVVENRQKHVKNCKIVNVKCKNINYFEQITHFLKVKELNTHVAKERQE